MSDPTRQQDQSPRLAKRLVLLAAKLFIVGVVLWFVSDMLRSAYSDLRSNRVEVSWGWAVACGVCYAIGLAPMAWFWNRALHVVNQSFSRRDLLAAYYLGHLGKYAPGKGMVIVLRVGWLRQRGGRVGGIVASVFLETLTFMAAGGAIAAVLAIGAEAADDQPWLVPLALILAAVAVIPTLPPIARWLVGWIVLKRTGKSMKPAASARLTWRLLAAGWAAAAASWLLLGLSTWMAARSVAADYPLSFESLRDCVLAATLPVVAGFMSLVPGGALVRDGLMMRILDPSLGAGPALAAALVARLAWAVSEAVACVIFYALAHRPAPNPNRSPDSSGE